MGVDEGISYLDQLAVQRSRELKKAVAEWMTPKTQTPRISTNFGKSSVRRFRDADTQTQISCHQHGSTQSRKVTSPKHESLLHEVLHDFDDKHKDSKVTFSKGSPEERYIFI